jgi:predicted PurR-regulated permease PerM
VIPSEEAPGRPLEMGQVAHATLVVLGLTGLAVLAWWLTEILLLVFAAILVASILRTVAGLLRRCVPISENWSLALACLIILAAIIGFAVLLGGQVTGEFSTLIENLPRQLASLGERLGMGGLTDHITAQAENFVTRGNLLHSIAGLTSGLLGMVTNVLLVAVAGVYMACSPDLYRVGALTLVPPNVRPNVGTAFRKASNALRLWLIGQLVAMAIVGVMTSLGLFLLGMPSALALGMIAAFAEFIPVIGPILASIPALLLASGEGDNMVLWVAALYIGVQQIESNVLTPIIQHKAVDLPPVLTLFALLAFGLLFGPLGVILGTPMTVVLYVLVKQLYVRDALQEPSHIPGEVDQPG